MLARESYPVASDKQAESLHESPGDLLERQCSGARRRHFDRQGDSIQLPANAADGLGVALIELETPPRGSGALAEEPDCVKPLQLVD
ncbi:MAG: hypothetical protein ACM3MF_07665, partial [Anaerolineae bacterium]